MQETFDLYTLIIVITFLGILLLLAYLINKKKEFFKSHINKNRNIQPITSVLLGGGNKAILFKINQKDFLVVSNKNSISNILPLEGSSFKQISEDKS